MRQSAFEVGDVVEIRGLRKQFDGCLATIEEVCSWGFKATVRGPSPSGTAEYPIQIAWEHFSRGWRAFP